MTIYLDQAHAVTHAGIPGIPDQTELRLWNFERQEEAVLMRKGQFRLGHKFHCWFLLSAGFRSAFTVIRPAS